jgi:hypothetical protein
MLDKIDGKRAAGGVKKMLREIIIMIVLLM